MNARRQSYHRWHRCGASSDTDIHGLGKVSVSVEDGISVISGSRMAGRRFTTEHTERATPVTEYTEGLRRKRLGFQCVQCAAGGGFSVCAVV